MRYTNYKKFQIKNKEQGLVNFAGRNNCGKITVNHKGGGHKKKFKKLNDSRMKISTGITCSILYDPCWSANIAAIYDFYNKTAFYVLAPKNLKIGDILKTNNTVEPKLGYSLPLNQIPIGSYIYNISTQILNWATISKAAGTFSIVQEQSLYFTKIKLSSNKIKTIYSICYASLGIVSNDLLFLWKLKKAGQNRWLNKKPTVRGVAMNPVDHPHGGGEGKKSGKNKTPWGKTN